jgi:Domain of unknown function (DUF5666)
MTQAILTHKASQGIFHGSLALLFVVVLAAPFIGCGGSGNSSGPQPGQNTTVALLLTSTANDQLTEFDVAINTVQLIDQAGRAITLYSYNNQVRQPAEFMRLNGASEPLAIATVPQGVYTSAAVATDGCQFTVVRFGPPSQGQPNTLNTEIYAQGLCGQGTGQTTVNLPSPITVSGSTMALSLNLQASQSYTLTGTGAGAAYTISPVFSLAPSAISPSPTNDQNGKIVGVDAQVTSIGANGSAFAVQTISDVPLSLNSNSNTVFQGISGVSSLSTGELVNVDFAIQSDGSLLATRVEVDDPSASGEFVGPWLAYTGNADVFIIEPVTCYHLPDNAACDSVIRFTNTTTFGISGQVNNLQNLPFTPSFSSSPVMLGANFSTYPTGARDSQGEPYSANVIVRPQTINGTVTSMSTTNGFSVYTVALAPYDLIPTLQDYLVLPSPSQLSPPSSVVVYADSNTQLLNSGPIAQGSLLRFRGLIFDDNGTARMDCLEILDGVTE